MWPAFWKFYTHFVILFNPHKTPRRLFLNHHFTDKKTTSERLSDLPWAVQLRNHKSWPCAKGPEVRATWINGLNLHFHESVCFCKQKPFREPGQWLKFWDLWKPRKLWPQVTFRWPILMAACPTALSVMMEKFYMCIIQDSRAPASCDEQALEMCLVWQRKWFF